MITAILPVVGVGLFVLTIFTALGFMACAGAPAEGSLLTFPLFVLTITFGLLGTACFFLTWWPVVIAIIMVIIFITLFMLGSQ